MSAGGIDLNGPHIRRLRENLGLTATQLAQRAGVSSQFLSNIELGHRRATPPTARAIADVLGVELGDIRA